MKINSNTIYKCITSSALFGIVIPPISVISRIKNRPDLQKLVTEKIDNEYLNIVFEYIIDILPNLYGNIAHLEGSQYYIRWMVYNIISLVLLIVFKSKVLKKIDIAKKYYNKKPIIFYSIIFCIVTYQSKLFLGFWFPGISGWDYSQHKSSLKEYSSSRIMLNEKKQNTLLKGINEDYFLEFYDEGCLPGEVLLGYSSDSVFAINHGIAGIVFPYRFTEDKNDFWLKIVNHRLQKLNALKVNYPSIYKLKYPEHAVYEPIDEMILSKVSKLDSIASYAIEICVKDSLLTFSKVDLLALYD